MTHALCEPCGGRTKSSIMYAGEITRALGTRYIFVFGLNDLEHLVALSCSRQKHAVKQPLFFFVHLVLETSYERFKRNSIDEHRHFDMF